MKTILIPVAGEGGTTLGEILELAEREDVILRTPDGKAFAVIELEDDATDEDFAQEVALTRGNAALRELLAERSREPGTYTLEQLRHELDLRERSE